MNKKTWIILGSALLIMPLVGFFFFLGSHLTQDKKVSSKPVPQFGKEYPSFSGTPSGKAVYSPGESKQAAHPVRQQAEIAATIRIHGNTYTPIANDLGEFGRIPIDTKDKGEVYITYPEANPGDTVIVQMVDGGFLDNKSGGKVVKLDEKKSATFQFFTAVPNGLYRIVLHKEADTKVLNFWAGPEQEFRD